jgi:hypothetical protein
MKAPNCHTIGLHGGLYVNTIMDCYEWPHTALNIALRVVLYLQITMTVMKGTTLPLL